MLCLVPVKGFDVPEANVVISYDHLKDAVELCQRTGRARDPDSCIVILDERPDRPLTMLENVRAMQDAIAEAYVPSSIAMNQETARSRQLNREQTALRSILERHPRSPQHSLKAMNEFTSKTRALLTDDFRIGGDGRFHCTLTYQSNLRSLTVNEVNTSKKIAKQFCALSLLATLETALS